MPWFYPRAAEVLAVQWQPGVNDVECGVQGSYTIEVPKVARGWLPDPKHPRGGWSVKGHDWIVTGPEGRRFPLSADLFRLVFEGNDSGA